MKESGMEYVLVIFLVNKVVQFHLPIKPLSTDPEDYFLIYVYGVMSRDSNHLSMLLAVFQILRKLQGDGQMLQPGKL